MNLANSPNCLVCGVRESNTHIFMECLMVREAWGWVRMRISELLPEGNARCSNFDMINLKLTFEIFYVKPYLNVQ
jgi:hypothetical protein